MSNCSACNSYFDFSTVKYRIGSDLILCESCYNIWKQKQLKQGDKLIDDSDGMRIYQDVVSTKNGEKTKKILMVCPYCQKEFDYNVDVEKVGAVTDALNVETVCPHCNSVLKVSICKIIKSGNIGTIPERDTPNVQSDVT